MNSWLEAAAPHMKECHGFAKAIIAEYALHRKAILLLDQLLASVRDAIDRMRSSTAQPPPD